MRSWSEPILNSKYRPRQNTCSHKLSLRQVNEAAVLQNDVTKRAQRFGSSKIRFTCVIAGLSDLRSNPRDGSRGMHARSVANQRRSLGNADLFGHQDSELS